MCSFAHLLFALSLFALSLFALLLKSLNLKSNCEHLADVALYKRATWANRSHGSLKIAMWVICSWFERISLQKIVIFICFDSFSAFSCPRGNEQRATGAICSWKTVNRSCCLFVMSDLSDSLPALFTKEWRRDLLFFRSISLFRSFAHKKRVNRSKNRWADS